MMLFGGLFVMPTNSFPSANDGLDSEDDGNEHGVVGESDTYPRGEWDKVQKQLDKVVRSRPAKKRIAKPMVSTCPFVFRFRWQLTWLM